MQTVILHHYFEPIPLFLSVDFHYFILFLFFHFLAGIEHPCTIICRTKHWAIPYNLIQAVIIGYKLFANRLAELLVHKPGEGLVLSLLATFLSPLVMLWIYDLLRFMRSKLVINSRGDS